MSEKSEHAGLLCGCVPRILMGYFWFAFFGLVLLISFAYVFEDNPDLFIKVVKFLIYAALFTVTAVPFISLTILLFSKKPVVEVGNGMVRFPIIGLALNRDEVANAIPQKSKVSDYWRVAIELRPEKQGRYRIWLLWPAAFSWGRKVFILTMFFGASEAELQRRIVEILAPTDPASELK